MFAALSVGKTRLETVTLPVPANYPSHVPDPLTADGLRCQAEGCVAHPPLADHSEVRWWTVIDIWK